MRTAIIALAAAALLSAPAAAVQDVSGKSPGAQHHVAKKHHAGVAQGARRPTTQAKGHDYPRTYAPAAPGVSDQDFVRSRQFGGGGGGSM